MGNAENKQLPNNSTAPWNLHNSKTVANVTISSPSSANRSSKVNVNKDRQIGKSAPFLDNIAKPTSKDGPEGYKVAETLKPDEGERSKSILPTSEINSRNLFRNLSGGSELSLRTENFISNVSMTEKRKYKMKKMDDVRRYSSGIAFYNKANVKRVCCDQLSPLDVHKERFSVNKERRYWVIRKLYKIGGWIRDESSKKEKDRIFVQANSPAPSFLNNTRTKTKRCDADQFDYLDPM